MSANNYTIPPGASTAACGCWCSRCDELHFAEPYPCAKERKSEKVSLPVGLAKYDLCDESRKSRRESRKESLRAHPEAASIEFSALREADLLSNLRKLSPRKFMSVVAGSAKVNAIAD